MAILSDFCGFNIPAQFVSEVEWEDDEQYVYYTAEMIEVDALMQHLAAYRAGGEPDLALTDFYTEVCAMEEWDMDVIREKLEEVNKEVEAYSETAFDNRNEDTAENYYD